MENQKALKKVSNKDLRKVFLHSLAIMCSWNYERQMHMGFMYGMEPVLDKLYADDEERKKKAYQRHMEFFNCTPQLTPFIMGLAASMEEQNANSEEGEFQTESISMIKTSLMGPFAGIGDSFFQGTIRNHFRYRTFVCTAGQHPGTDSRRTALRDSVTAVCLQCNLPRLQVR